MGMFSPQASAQTDGIANILHLAARICLIGGISLLPILFIPVTAVPLLDGKLYIATLLVSITLVFTALLVLRVGTLTVPASLTLGSIWLVAAVSIASAGLSGDVTDSLVTISGTTYTAATIAIGAFVLTVVAIVGQHVRTAAWVLRLLAAASALLVTWHALRLVTGFDLSFGLFPNQTTSVIGNWNDLAIVAAGIALASVLTAAQQRVAVWVRWVMLLVLVAALFVLLIINNPVLWSVLGIIALTIVVTAITRRQQVGTPAMLTEGSVTGGSWLLAFASVIFAAALLVMLGGSTLQNALTNATDSSFIEVRPSVNASLDVVRGVWGSDVMLGTGPARYADAWRQHKSDAINETIFWNTQFGSGHNFLLTQAVEVGLLGLIAWVTFFVLLLISGARTFLFVSVPHKDSRYQLALTTYVLAVFLWATFIVGNPGVPMFLLAASLTGLYIGLSFGIRPRQLASLSLLNNQRLSFLIVATLVVIIILVVWFLQQMTQQLLATTAQNQALRATDGDSVETISQKLNESFLLFRNDNAMRTDAQLHLVQLRQLLQVEQPTAEQQQAFQRLAVQAVNAATLATEVDPTNPENWYVQAQVFAVLAQAEVEGALERAQSAIDRASEYDPKSPRPALVRAELAALSNDLEQARTYATESIQKKSNYTPALFQLAQIEIAAGNVEQAITVTESILSFEPNNPARWYQLGVLYQANQQLPEAVAALSRAIELDQNYANALYIRALIYADAGEQAAAEADLNRVIELNPDNQQLVTLLEQISSGSLGSGGTGSVSLSEIEAAEAAVSEDSINDAASESDLVTTTTNVPEESDETANDPDADADSATENDEVEAPDSDAATTTDE